MFTERTSVGLDVHARSVAAAAIHGVTNELVQCRLTPSHEHILCWLRDLPGPVAVGAATCHLPGPHYISVGHRA